MAKIHNVIEKKDVFALYELLKNPKNLNLERSSDTENYRHYETPLTTAARVDSPECLRLLISSKANLDECGTYGTAVIVAVKKGNVTCLRLLIEAGADMNAAETYLTNARPTAATLAAKFGETECLRLLIEKGADLDLADDDKKDARIHAAENNKIKCLEMLRNADRAKSKAGDKQKNHSAPALNFADHSNLKQAAISATQQGHTECLRLLIDKITPKELLAELTTVAVVNGKTECLHFLIELNANVSQKNSFSQNTIELSAMHGHTECLRLLLKKKIDINVRNNNGKTPLVLAAEGGHIICMALLLVNGATVSELDKKILKKHKDKLFEAIAYILPRNDKTDNALTNAIYKKTSLGKIFFAKRDDGYISSFYGKECSTNRGVLKKIVKELVSRGIYKNSDDTMLAEVNNSEETGDSDSLTCSSSS